MKTRIRIIGLLLLFGLASQPLQAATYKYQDESGNTVYSQNPPENPNTPYEVLGVPSHARPGSDSPPASAPTLQQEESNGKSTVAQEQEQAQKIREENCAAAKKQLEIYTVYRRVRNEEGDIVRVDDQTRQQKIDEAKQAIQDFCD